MTITYRILTEMTDLEQVCELEYKIWGYNKGAATPPVVMRVTNAHGGVTVGAFDNSQPNSPMIGMAWAFTVPRDDSPTGWALWSHVAGVLPEYRSRGVGFGLKMMQRAWGLEHGYTTMHWTFDPMQAKNANFNFRVLGAVVHKYKPDFYGRMEDKLNPGLPSDRFETTWILNSQRAQIASNGTPLPPATDRFPKDAFLVRYRDGEFVLHQPEMLTAPHYFIEIPGDFGRLMETSPQTGAAWQGHMRDAMLRTLAAGYVVVDCVRAAHTCLHVLAREIA